MGGLEARLIGREVTMLQYNWPIRNLCEAQAGLCVVIFCACGCLCVCVCATMHAGVCTGKKSKQKWKTDLPLGFILRSLLSHYTKAFTVETPYQASRGSRGIYTPTGPVEANHSWPEVILTSENLKEFRCLNSLSGNLRK